MATKVLPEFPSEWHQTRYLEDLEREKAGTVARGDTAYEATVQAEIDRVKKAIKPKPGRPAKT